MALAHAIVGREAELAVAAGGSDWPGPPHAVFVEGDAGVGKTALLGAVVEGAAMPVLRARPTAAEAASSYAALHDLLQPVLDGLDALPAPQRRALAAALLLEDAADPVDPRLVALACRSLLAARPGEVLLAVDDWQWLDAATSAVLTFVLRRLEPGGAKVIATVRSGEADDALAALVHALPEGHALELAVAPLDAPALADLVHARTGERPAPPRARAPARGVRGQPVDGARADPRARGGRRDGRASAARPAGSPSCHPTRARFSAVVAALAEPTVDAVGEDGLEAALAADVLARDGHRLRFTHPLIAAVVEERTPPAEWRAIHARLAESATSQEQRARHLAAAADGPDEAVAAALQAAAGEAEARGAPIAAAELAERAAELTPVADVQRRIDRLLAAATAAIDAVDGQGARRLLDEVLAEHPVGRQRAHALHKLAYLVTDDSAPRLIELALEEAGDDDVLRAEIHSDAYMFHMMGGGIEVALQHAEPAVVHAEAAGSAGLLAAALSSLAFFRHSDGQGVQRELLLRADALERQSRTHVRDDTPAQILGLQLYVNGDLAESRELLLAELDRARRRGYLDHEALRAAAARRARGAGRALPPGRDLCATGRSS